MEPHNPNASEGEASEVLQIRRRKEFPARYRCGRTGCSSLTARLAVAELEVSERREDAKRLAVEGADDGVLDKAEAKLRAAQDRVATLSSALAETKQKITVLEAEQAAAADKKLRSETVAEIDKAGSGSVALARPEATSALKYRNTSRTIGMVNGTWSLAEAANACIPEQSGATSEMRAEMVAS